MVKFQAEGPPLPALLSPPPSTPPSSCAGNTVRQNLLSTGAFEVSYQGVPVFSKLATGRMPTLQEMVAGVAQAMRGAAGGAGADAGLPLM